MAAGRGASGHSHGRSSSSSSLYANLYLWHITQCNGMGNDNVSLFQIIRLHHTNAEFYFTSSAGYEVYSFCYRHCPVLDSVAIFLYKARRWCIWSHNISNGTRQCSLYNLGSALTQPEARPRLRWPRRWSLGLRGATVSVGLRRQPAPHNHTPCWRALGGTSCF